MAHRPEKCRMPPPSRSSSAMGRPGHSANRESQESRPPEEDIMFRFSKPTPTATVTTTYQPAGEQANRLGFAARTSPTPRDPHTLPQAHERQDLAGPALMLPPGPGGSLSAGPGMCSGPGWLLFRRIVDIPFAVCVAILESWRHEGRNGELQVGRSRLRGPADRDRGSGTCRVEVRLARGPLCPMSHDWKPATMSRH
jgi:hypothetical protein